jgi:hypothetical protein
MLVSLPMTLRRALIACALAATLPSGVHGQAPGAADTTLLRVERTPPLSPRKAFVTSLLVPGYAQSVFGRGRTGTLLVAFESVALVMIRESSSGLREARRNLADSVIVSYVDANGTPAVRWERTPFSRALVRSRQEQVEDWIAVLVGNHLFSAIDAYVAAHLWDVPLEVGMRATEGSRGLALRLYW